MPKEKLEFVTDRQFDSYASRVFNRSLKLYGSSVTANGIARRANPFVVEIWSDGKGMMVQPGWREAMKVDDRPALERASLMMRKTHRRQSFAGKDYTDLMTLLAEEIKAATPDETILIAALIHETPKHGMALKTIHQEFGQAVGKLVSILNPLPLATADEFMEYLSLYDDARLIMLTALKIKRRWLADSEKASAGELGRHYDRLIAILEGKPGE